MPNKVQVAKQKNCIHHWIIEPPGAHVSYGKCKRCGKVAEFYNTYISDLVNRTKLPDKTPAQPID
jgi:hypothetical protein